MNAQPHDRASHSDHVPVLDDPQLFHRPRLSLHLLKRQHSAAQDARSVLDRIKQGQTTPTDRPTVAPRPTTRDRLHTILRQLPPRFIGHAVVLALVLLVVVSGGLPALALRMDWTQGATVATDHVDTDVYVAAPEAAAAPIIISGAATASPDAAAEHAPDALVPALLPRQNVPLSPFVTTHKVAPGEKLGQIAQRYDVSVMSIVAANDIDTKMLAIGEELRIPRVSGLPHKVADGETVETIAEEHNVPSSAIRFFPANNLGTGRPLVVGEELYVPGAIPIGNGPSEAEVSDLTATAVGTVLDDETRVRVGPGTDHEKVAKLPADAQVALIGRHDNWFKIRTTDGSEGWIAADLLGVGDGIADQVPIVVDVPVAPAPVVAETDQPAPEEPPAPPPQPSNQWVWPTAGDLTSGFGYRNFSVGRFHNGIDIANRKNTIIRAARAGRVIEAGWCSGYGYCVKINHGDGFVTEYGHMASQPNVRVGQSVDAGQRIGLMGSTYDRKGGGYSTGVHLHFTVKRNGQAVNPMRYLP